MNDCSLHTLLTSETSSIGRFAVIYHSPKQHRWKNESEKKIHLGESVVNIVFKNYFKKVSYFIVCGDQKYDQKKNYFKMSNQ